MQLSSKAGPVVLKPFTNVHSPILAQQLPTLRRTHSRSHWAPTLLQPRHQIWFLFPQPAIWSWSQGPAPPCEHFPIPSLLQQSSSCAIHLPAPRAWKRSRAAPALFAASILLPLWQNIRALLLSGLAVLGQACLGQGAGKSPAGGVQEQRKVSKHCFAAQLLT